MDDLVKWKCGNELAPYHPSASHVPPDYRDGWNDCYRAMQVERDALRAQVLALQGDAERLDKLQNWVENPDAYIAVWRTLLDIWMVEIGNGGEFENFKIEPITDGHRSIRAAIDSARMPPGEVKP